MNNFLTNANAMNFSKDFYDVNERNTFFKFLEIKKNEYSKSMNQILKDYEKNKKQWNYLIKKYTDYSKKENTYINEVCSIFDEYNFLTDEAKSNIRYFICNLVFDEFNVKYHLKYKNLFIHLLYLNVSNQKAFLNKYCKGYHKTSLFKQLNKENKDKAYETLCIYYLLKDDDLDIIDKVENVIKTYVLNHKNEIYIYFRNYFFSFDEYSIKEIYHYLGLNKKS